MAGKYKGFRFNPELYATFSSIVDRSGCTLTAAYEKFMKVCVERGELVFPEANVEGFEAEVGCWLIGLGKASVSTVEETEKKLTFLGGWFGC